MFGWTLLLLALQVAPPDPSLDAVRKSIEKTAAAGYAYRVQGRYLRTGEFKPESLLTSRIKQYQSVRLQLQILVKGPEGLWKTPEERLGEKVEHPDPEAVDIVRALQEATPPHAIVQDLLPLVQKGGAPEDAEVNGVLCRKIPLPFTPAAVKESLERQMGKAIQAGSFKKPDEIRWDTAKGGLRAYIGKDDGLLLKVVDERSVRVINKTNGDPETRSYKNMTEIEFADWGRAKPSLPKEVKDRLKIEEE